MGITVTLDQVDVQTPPADDPLADWWQFRVIVQPLLGTGAYSDQYDDPIGLHAWVRNSVTLVRDTTGKQVVSSTTVLLPRNAPASIGPGALVLLPPEFGSRETVAITAARNLGADLPEHVKLACE